MADFKYGVADLNCGLQLFESTNSKFDEKSGKSSNKKIEVKGKNRVKSARLTVKLYKLCVEFIWWALKFVGCKHPPLPPPFPKNPKSNLSLPLKPAK